MIVGIWTCREDWYQQASVAYGDQNVGTLVNQGGKVFVPYSTASLVLYDQNGVGNATVEILATPVMCGDVPQGSSSLYGLKSFQAEAEGDATVTVPKNANMFAVARGELTSTPWEITAIGWASNRVFWAFQMATGNATAGLVTELPWRTCPPEGASTQGTIKITNEDAANTASGYVWFRFDFAQGR
jgi:hypothetical protein